MNLYEVTVSRKTIGKSVDTFKVTALNPMRAKEYIEKVVSSGLFYSVRGKRRSVYVEQPLFLKCLNPDFRGGYVENGNGSTFVTEEGIKQE